MMLKGVDIIVWRKTLGEVDEMGEPIKNWESETVSNVLYAPAGAEWLVGPSGQLPAGYRPDGTEDTIVAYFPKAYTKSLAGCELEAFDRRWKVQGDPIGNIEHLTPGAWNRTVKAKKVDG